MFPGVRHKTLLSAAVLCLGVPAGNACAQTEPERVRQWLDDSFHIEVGAFQPVARTRARFDAFNGAIGTKIDLENDLDLEHRALLFDVSFAERFRERHVLSVEYFELRRSGDQRLTADINFGDQVFSVGADVSSYFDTEVLRLSYSYSIVRSERRNIGFYAGVHVTRFSMGITSRRDGTPTDARSEVVETTAPLPVIGLGGEWFWGDRWLFRGAAQTFRLAVSDYEGAIDHWQLAFEYAFRRRVAFGVGYDYFAVDVSKESKHFNGMAEFDFSGPKVYAHFHF
jgi:hypothetical protein